MSLINVRMGTRAKGTKSGSTGGGASSTYYAPTAGSADWAERAGLALELDPYAKILVNLLKGTDLTSLLVPVLADGTELPFLRAAEAYALLSKKNLLVDGIVSASAGAPGSIAASALGDLTDVTLSAVQNGQALVFENGQWVNKAIGGGAEGAVTALGVSGGYLTWTKDGVTNNLIVPYADSASALYNKGVPTDLNSSNLRMNGIYTYNQDSANRPTGYGSVLQWSNVNIPIGGSHNHWLTQLASGTYGEGLWYRTRTNSDGWLPWEKILTSVNYASQLDSRYAKLASPNNLVHSGNEFTFVGDHTTDNIWLNYRLAPGGSNGIGNYHMGNGLQGGYAKVVALGFVVPNGGSSSQFLKADGSLDSNAYVKALAGSECDGIVDINDWQNYKTVIGSADVNGNSPSGSRAWFNVIQLAHRNGGDDGPNYVGQIAVGMTVHDRMWFRSHRTRSWLELIHSGNFESTILEKFGWSSTSRSATWGTQTGTVLSTWNDVTGGSLAFRRDNPVAGEMSAVINGYWYQNEGRYRCLDTSDADNIMCNLANFNDGVVGGGTSCSSLYSFIEVLISKGYGRSNLCAGKGDWWWAAAYNYSGFNTSGSFIISKGRYSGEGHNYKSFIMLDAYANLWTINTQEEGVATMRRMLNSDENAVSATKWQSPRRLWGQYADGTADVNGHLSVGAILPQNNTGRAELSIVSEGGYPCDLMLGSHGAAKWSITARDSGENYNWYLYNYMNGASALYVRADNNYVGIGTTNPSERLTLNGWVGTLYGGWYSIPYGGGIYMDDSYWVKTYNKPLYIGPVQSIGANSFNVGLKIEHASHSSLEVSSDGCTMGLGCHSNGSWYWWYGSGDAHSRDGKRYVMDFNGSNWNFQGNIITSGLIRASGEIISTFANAFRAVQGNYGFIIRNDGSNTYFLFTAPYDQYGSWNHLRPLYISNISGDVTMEHNLEVRGNIMCKGVVAAAA